MALYFTTFSWKYINIHWVEKPLFIGGLTYIHVYIHTYVHTYIQTDVCTNVHMYVHTYICTIVHTYIHTYMIYFCLSIGYVTSSSWLKKNLFSMQKPPEAPGNPMLLNSPPNPLPIATKINQ